MIRSCTVAKGEAKPSLQVSRGREARGGHLYCKRHAKLLLAQRLLPKFKGFSIETEHKQDRLKQTRGAVENPVYTGQTWRRETQPGKNLPSIKERSGNHGINKKVP